MGIEEGGQGKVHSGKREREGKGRCTVEGPALSLTCWKLQKTWWCRKHAQEKGSDPEY